MIKITEKKKTDSYGNQIFSYHDEIRASPHIIDYIDEKIRNQIISPTEIIISDEKITLQITYPLSIDVLREYEHKGGFSRKDLFQIVYEAYKKIYDEEEEQVGDPGTIKGMDNRDRSYGKYGIWGHYLKDLYLENIKYNPKTKIVCLGIGS